jgi:glutamyl-tRNA synthetase
MNRPATLQVIDPIAPRHTGITTQKMVPLTLSNGPADLELTTGPKHKKNAEVGHKTIYKLRRILVEQEDALSVSVEEEV